MEGHIVSYELFVALIFQDNIKPESKLNQSMLKSNETIEVRICTF
jgi:hypothetical protein